MLIGDVLLRPELYRRRPSEPAALRRSEACALRSPKCCGTEVSNAAAENKPPLSRKLQCREPF